MPGPLTASAAFLPDHLVTESAIVLDSVLAGT
jgi:hypothetical protein